MATDYTTSTVDGAEGFERMHGEPYDDGTPTLDELMREEAEDEDYDDEPECNCSDPGCPCGGIKKGGL